MLNPLAKVKTVVVGIIASTVSKEELYATIRRRDLEIMALKKLLLTKETPTALVIRLSELNDVDRLHLTNLLKGAGKVHDLG